jgi:dTMP kinase
VHGIFISFEGGDGVGKSTQARLLGQWLGRVTGREVVLTREPGGTELGLQLRRAVLHGPDMDPRTEALLYAADRAYHVASLVRPALERGAVVITDRYLDSSVAYQAGGRELPASEVEGLSLWAAGGLLPAVTVLVDLDAGTGLARRVAAPEIGDNPDRLERAGTAFHRRVRQAYLERAAADPGRWIVADGAGTPAQIHAAVRTAVAARLDPGEFLPGGAGTPPQRGSTTGTTHRGGSAGAQAGAVVGHTNPAQGDAGRP